jgi:hypothetical protein
MAKILITGGSGSIGKHLIPKLLFKGHKVAIIGRSKRDIPGVESFVWDLKKGSLDERAFKDVSHIIHLAGAGIANKSWSPARKKEILESRVQPMQLLANALKSRNQRIKAFVSSSAVGYYGGITSDKIYSEIDIPENDFLGSTCKMWEDAVQYFKQVADREVRVRTSVVLMNNAGALPKLALPTKLGFGAAIGSGKQWMPWIHIDDLTELYLETIENDRYNGPFNAVAPQHVNQTDLIRAIGKTLNRTTFLPPVPRFLVKIVLGEMATVVIEGSRVSSQRLIDTGFEFQYPNIQTALTDLLK